ncbi:thioesterase II family protein [Kitasatospora azatica]|uniref:thioesterase II family protein n=1 Tax=Kitasatospora azatica TaxID=58347 RepID=UPI00068B8A3C|nr:alpha/beta fold hydrolase [Kitasatospora azatica]
MSGAARQRLFCFHHAGAGSSAFARWQHRLGPGTEVVPVLLPGRDNRRREPRITDHDRLVAELVEQLGPLTDLPYALYGHSLGGLVAHTFARAATAAGLPPARLAVIGAVLPPHLDTALLGYVDMPDGELLRRLVAHGMLPQEALEGGASSLWRRTVLPVLRDDLMLARALRAAAAPLPDVPVLALAGLDDAIAPVEGVAQWRRWAGAGFELRTVPGGHVFVRDRALPALLREVLDALPPAVRPESSTV